LQILIVKHFRNVPELLMQICVFIEKCWENVHHLPVH